MIPDNLPILVSFIDKTNSNKLLVKNLRHTYLLLICTFYSCTLFPPEEAFFGFLEVPETQLVTNAQQAYPSHAIKDIWAYADEDVLGVYSIPASIPVLVSGGDVQFRLRGGIKPNGNQAQSIEYPFFKEILFSKPLSENEVIAYTPQFEYKDEAVFDLAEDFETGNQFTADIDGNDATKLERVAGQTPYGNYCGYVHLDASADAIEVSHFASFPNSNNKKGAVFLEFDYKCDEKIFVGTILESDGVLVKDYKVLITESDEWNKFYLDLTNEISQSKVNTYKVVFSAALVSGGSEANIYLDNIKLIHF